MRYQFACKIIRAEGQQFFVVDAGSEKEAVNKAQRHEWNFVSEEIEVVEMGKPELVSEEVV